RHTDSPTSDKDVFSPQGQLPGVSARRVVLWVGLAATASALLLSVTNHMCQDTAVIPLLWVFPLVLYLTTLMLAFESDRMYRRWLFPPLFGLSVVGAVYLMFVGSGTPLMYQIGIDAAVLFFGCMVCHGELAKSRPGAERLTLFYFSVALGGALGGFCVAVLAPLLFNGFWEFHASLFAAGVAFLLALTDDQSSFLYRNPWVNGPALLTVVLVLGGILVNRIQNSEDDVRFATRNFYGVLRVIEDRTEGEMELLHGRITHGIQYEDSDRSRIPTSYYTEESGIGLAIVHHPLREKGLRIGVIGLGVGTIAAYVRPSDTIRFYEINPAVLRLSTGPKPFFTYLKDCPGHADVVLGDARLMLEDELRKGYPQRFDVLAVDAFSSDAIPVHLLTKEALEVYRKHLRMPYGVVAVHISNRYLNLVPLVHGLAKAAHAVSMLVTVERNDSGGFGSEWVLLSPSPAEFALRVMREAATPWDSVGDRPVRLWTDDYSNLIALLK
ncbi:MAG TPA: ferrichrome ABC transporter permease, partial [Bacteroidota bacterium]|nr:ferrichrome ABC transporter permease [Bacteroidota bacterium]